MWHAEERKPASQQDADYARMRVRGSISLARHGLREGNVAWVEACKHETLPRRWIAHPPASTAAQRLILGCINGPVAEA